MLQTTLHILQTIQYIRNRNIYKIINYNPIHTKAPMQPISHIARINTSARGPCKEYKSNPLGSHQQMVYKCRLNGMSLVVQGMHCTAMEAGHSQP